MNISGFTEEALAAVEELLYAEYKSTRINMPANAVKSNCESKINLNEHQRNKRVIRLGQISCGDAAVCREVLARKQPKKLLLHGSNVRGGHSPCEKSCGFSGIIAVTTKTKNVKHSDQKLNPESPQVWANRRKLHSSTHSDFISQ